MVAGYRSNGPDGSPAWSEGVGLRNTRDRLRHLYGDAQDLSMQAREGGGAVISIVMPLRLAGADLVGRRPRAEAGVA